MKGDCPVQHFQSGEKNLLIQLEINVTFYSKPYPDRVIVYSNRVHNILILKSATF